MTKKLVKEGKLVGTSKRGAGGTPRQNFEGYTRRDSAAILASSQMSEQDINNITNRLNSGSLNHEDIYSSPNSHSGGGYGWEISPGQQSKALDYLQRAVKHDTALREPKNTMFAYSVGGDIEYTLGYDEDTKKFDTTGTHIVVKVVDWTEIRNLVRTYSGTNLAPVYHVARYKTNPDGSQEVIESFEYVYTAGQIWQYS